MRLVGEINAELDEVGEVDCDEVSDDVETDE